MFPLSETILSIHVFKLSPGDQLFSMCSLHIYDIVKLLKTIFSSSGLPADSFLARRNNEVLALTKNGLAEEKKV